MVILPHRRKIFRPSIINDGDPFYTNVSLLLHCDGANGSTTFTDNSPSQKTITALGNAQITTVDPKFGTGAILLDGTGDYVRASASADFNFGTGNFTIEFFVRWTNLVGPSGLHFLWDTGTAGTALRFQDGNNFLFYLEGVVQSGILVTGLTINTWYHIAVVRSGTSVNLYLDGILRGTRTTSAALGNSTLPFTMGALGSGGFATQGRLDEFRVTKGVARYTANFTPPTAPFPNS
jgi:hypothetical protein